MDAANNAAGDPVNLEDIREIPESDFKKHFLQWIQDDNVAKALQAKLRKDLFENFNKTSLGKKIAARHDDSQRMMLSPLVLALNSLVAEFLYAQNCHFTLSVFSSEAPYRHTLPDFENQDNFRFNKNDLIEIFEAISMDLEDSLTPQIVELYLASANQRQTSLLFAIFKCVFNKTGNRKTDDKHNGINTIENTSVKQISDTKKVCGNVKRTQNADMNQQKPSSNNQLHYLNKYLIILSKKVKQMAYSIENLENKNDAKQKQKNRLRARKTENLNRSLEKISESLKELSKSKSKKQTNQFSLAISAVNKIAHHFEKCIENFERIVQKLTKPIINVEMPEAGKLLDDGQNYADWFSDLKTSRNGQKFILKIESALRKTLSREKDRMEKIYEERSESQRALLKLKYKQKILEISKNSVTQAGMEKDIKIKEAIDKKLYELDAKQKELLNKIAVNEKSTENMAGDSNQPVSSNCEKEVEKFDRRRYREVEKFNFIFDETFTPKLQELTSKIIEKEKNIEHIVFDAKLRIKELEHESNLLDRSFQDYLMKQKADKTRINDGLSSIWDNYQISKKILSAKNMVKPFVIANGNIDSESTIFENMSDMNQMLVDSNQTILTNDNKIEERKFENPFRQLKDKFLLMKSLTKENHTESTKSQPTVSQKYQGINFEDLISKKSKQPTVSHIQQNVPIKKIKQEENPKTIVHAERCHAEQSPARAEIIQNSTMNDMMKGNMIKICEEKSLSSTSSKDPDNKSIKTTKIDDKSVDFSKFQRPPDSSLQNFKIPKENIGTSKSSSSSYSEGLSISVGKDDDKSDKDFWE